MIIVYKKTELLNVWKYRVYMTLDYISSHFVKLRGNKIYKSNCVKIKYPHKSRYYELDYWADDYVNKVE